MEELKSIMKKFAESGWDLIAVWETNGQGCFDISDQAGG